ncbi:hypothetical protein ACFV2Z_37610 [Streptomyces sp. NPDC059688]
MLIINWRIGCHRRLSVGDGDSLPTVVLARYRQLTFGLHEAILTALSCQP